MSALVLTLRETLRYRGAIGQWSWVLHRVTGLGVVLFLTLHVVDTSWAVFYPELYEDAIAIYQSPLFTLGEFGLVACVIYHAFNGLRIIIFDYRPEWWKHQQRAAFVVLGLTAITLVPTFILMFTHVINHYSEPGVFIMPLDKVLLGQLPFAVGTAVAIMVAILASTVVGMFVRSGGTQQRPLQARGSGVERFWWRFMRASGVLIVPLVFGHLAMTHILQGVFDITAAGYTVVGTPAAAGVDCAALTIPVMGDGINCTGTAVEFVGERWNLLIGGIAVWRIYDVLLLSLVVIHGFNGLRYVLTDYTSFNPILKRAMIYTTIIGAVTLLTVGAGALVFSITPSAIEMAQEAQCKIGRLTDPLICGEASETAALEGNTTVTIVNPGS